jgi:hypothetical protein
MKYLLVWWIVNPHHFQVLHLERGFQSEVECLTYAAHLQAPGGKVIRKHCSLE